MRSAKTPLIYILSCADSGSTLLSLILGAHRQIASAGELGSFRQLCDNDGTHQKRCSCGLPWPDCPIWNQVVTRLRKDFGQHSIAVSDPASPHFAPTNATLLSAMAALTGKPITCDSSKNPVRLQKLQASGQFEITIVHLVRDGRAFALSALNKNLRRNRAGTKKRLAALGRVWSGVNRSFVDQFSTCKGYFLLRYEDLIINPQTALQPVLEQMGLEFQQQQTHFGAASQHLIGGNQVRFQRDARILPDVRYLNELDPFRWWHVTYAARRGLIQFGYSLTKSRSPLFSLRSGNTYRGGAHRAAA